MPFFLRKLRTSGRVFGVRKALIILKFTCSVSEAKEILLLGFQQLTGKKYSMRV